jgi:maleylacetate reductase
MTMQRGSIVFTAMERVIFGRPAAEAVAAEADRLGAKRVFILSGGTLNRETDEVARLTAALGPRFAGLCDRMPAHSPREAVVACANAARAAGADLMVTFGGGSVTDGGKVVTICLEHDIRDVDGLEPFRTIVDAEGVRHIPPYAGPKVRQITVPTTLSGGEFNARAGCTDTARQLKQSYENRLIVPVSVVLDPAPTVHTPEWLWLSTGIRAFDHAVESYCSLDANAYVDGAVLQALRLLHRGLGRVKAEPGDLEARLDCQIGAWLSMTGVVSGVRMGASHAIGHILGGTAGVPHGYTSCVMLPSVLAWNESVNGARQGEISAALGRPGVPASEVAHEFIAGLGLPRSLAAVGVSANRFPLLAENTMGDSWTYSNPRKIAGPEDVLRILELAA